MNSIIRTLGIIGICAALASPQTLADNRGRGRGGNPAPTHAPASRPGNGGNSHRPGNGGATNRPGNNTGNRPSNPGNRPSNPGNRPGNGGGNQRPGGNNSHRPGNPGNRPSNPGNRPGNNRPGNNHGGNHWRPGNDRPGGPGGHWDGHRPPRPPHAGNHHHGPHMRPHMRPHNPFFRPVPPPSWRPVRTWRPFRSILGIALGSSINISINALINSGYTVNSYGNDCIYLSNVPMLNLNWPDAIMYYNTAGSLYGSQFIYSTPGYNMNQYNMAYTTLSSAYGAPVSLQNLANGIEATWWGTGNQFIRLSFVSDYANNGLMRYYTTLSFGN